MGRSGVYKSDVEKARRALLAHGKNPSVDLVRVQLGNTGSRTTIHRFLKEIEAEDNAPVGAKVGVSDALQAHVAKLSEQLHEEAEARIAEHRAQFDVQLRAQVDAATEARKEALQLRETLQRAETALAAEQRGHQETLGLQQQARVDLATQGERLAAQEQRIGGQEAQIASLEEKHQQVRETLEHFRTSAQEQRVREQRQHEQALQALQSELRAALEQVAAKTAELFSLNKENGRLLEQVKHQQHSLSLAEQGRLLMNAELQSLRPLPNHVSTLEQRAARAIADVELAQASLAETESKLDQVRRDLQISELDRARVLAMLEGIQEALGKLSATDQSVDAGSPTLKKRRKGGPAEGTALELALK